MSSRRIALNTAQLAVLAWVRDGSPDGVYDDWSHRVTARTLHNRGLLVVRGHGSEWSATLTEDGTYYLATRAYPTAADEPSVLGVDPEDSRVEADDHRIVAPMSEEAWRAGDVAPPRSSMAGMPHFS